MYKIYKTNMIETLIHTLSDESDKLFDVYAVDGGIYWKIYIKRNGYLIINNGIPYEDKIILTEYKDDIIYNKEVNEGEIIYVNYKDEWRIKLLEIKFDDEEFYVSGFFLYSKKNISGLPGFIICGCFDGMTKRHQMLLKIATSIIKKKGYGCIYIDKGEKGELKHHSSWGFMNNYNKKYW